MKLNKIIMKTIMKAGASFKRGAGFLFVALFIFSGGMLSAQVISNTGASIFIKPNTVVVSKDVENSLGTLGNDGTITLGGNYSNNGTTGGNGYYNLKGNWINNGVFNPGTSTVTLNGTVNQNIINPSGETFYKLIINNPGRTITQIGNPGTSLGVLNDLDLTAGTLSLHPNTINLNVGGAATLTGNLLYNSSTTQTTSILGNLSGSGLLDMSGGDRPHLLNLSGSANYVGTFTTSPASASTVNYKGTDQTVFAAMNYRNLIISNSGTKILQGNSAVGIDLNITGGTFDLGTTTTSLAVQGQTAIAGSMSFNGISSKTVTLNGNLSGAGAIDMTGGNLSQLLNLYGVNNNIGSYTSGTGSLVDYILNGNQSVFSSQNYKHLRITGSGVKTIYTDITASGVLTMLSGNIDANGNTLKLTNNTVGALIRTNGTIVGKLERAVGTTGSDYLYPLGTLTVYNPMKISFNNLNTGPLTAQYKTGYIGADGLPIDDDGNEIFDTYTTGYWSLFAGAPMSTGSFNVNLNYAGFTGIDQSASIVKRTNGGNIEVDGTHGTIGGSEITRTVMVNGISPTTTDLAIGKGRPRIINQPQNTDICETYDALFQVTARGRGSLTYQWQVKIGVGAWTNISNGGVYTGAQTRKLELLGVPYTMNTYRYRVIITDAQGNPNTSDEALLTVNLIPVAVPSPAIQAACTGLPFTTITLTSYSPTTGGTVPGTTFAWSRTEPQYIVTNMPPTGVATGDQINGIFTNTSDSVVTVIFTVIPTGPGTTNCVGDPILVAVNVNPTPKVIPVLAYSAQCDMTATSIKLRSPSRFTSGFITFDYSHSEKDRFLVPSPGSITGFTTSTSNLPEDHVIADVLTNLTDGYQFVTYLVTPVNPVSGCPNGTPVPAVVTVNPTPKAVPLNNNNFKADSSICNTGLTDILMTSPTTMAPGFGNPIFDYTITKTGGAGIVTGNTNPATNLNPGDKIIFKYRNYSDTLQSVYFHITPKIDNAACVPGNIAISEIKIHPNPIRYSYPGTNGTGIMITDPITCEGGLDKGALRVIPTLGSAHYRADWIGPVGYTRFDSIEIRNINPGKYTVTVTDNLGCKEDTSINVISLPPRPQIFSIPILPNIHVSCPGGSDGSVRVYVSSGITPPYTYTILRNGILTTMSGIFTAIYNPADPNTFRVYTGLKSGTYTIVVHDVNGCEAIKATELKEPAPIKATFVKSNYSGFNVSCRGYSNGSAQVSTTGGNGTYSYNWYAASGTLTVSHNTALLDSIPAGKYYVVTRDLLNCTKLDSVTLVEPDGMQLINTELSHSPDGLTNISCNGGTDGSIKLTVSGGAAPYNYSWFSTGQTLPSTAEIKTLKAATYVATVSDQNGCVLRLLPGSVLPTYTLTEPTPLTVSGVLSLSNDGGYNVNCNGGTGSITVTPGGGSVGNYTYTWTTSDGSGIVQGQKDQSALKAGTYHLVVKDLNNCEIAKDFTLTQPPVFSIQLTGTNITCVAPGFNNGSVDLAVTGGVAPYAYLWSNGATTQDISNLTQGYYSVTVRYNNTCSLKDSVLIELPPPLTYTKTVSDYNTFNISCNGLSDGSISITPTSGKAPFIYNWTGPNGFTATTKDISNLRAGQYTIIITDLNSCTATETINMSEPGVLGMNFTLSSSIAGGFNINCAGANTGSIIVDPLNYVKSVDYLWSDGIFGKTRTNLTAGVYGIVITDANNCHAASSVTLTEPDTIKIEFDLKQPFCPDLPDGEIRLNVTGGVKGADYTYKWSDNSSASVITGVVRGLYSVKVTDLNGCSVKDSLRVEPLNESCLIIPNAISANDDLTNDVWNIGMINLYPEAEVKIFNRWGEMIWRSERGYPKPWDGKSNGKTLPIDSYHYIIDLNNGTKPIVGTITVVK